MEFHDLNLKFLILEKKQKKNNQKGLANLNRKNPVEHRKQEGSSIKTVLG